MNKAFQIFENNFPEEFALWDSTTIQVELPPKFFLAAKQDFLLLWNATVPEIDGIYRFDGIGWYK